MSRTIEDRATQLATLAHLDALTGVSNRRTWDLALALAMETASCEGVCLSVAIIDIDHLKKYNDTRGHPAGDTLLRDAAAAWRALLRLDDVLARYGGEEFTILSTPATAEQ